MAKKRGSTRNMNDLRSVLLEEIDDIRNGAVPEKRGQVVAKLASVVVSTIQAEVQFRKYVDSVEEFKSDPIQLT